MIELFDNIGHRGTIQDTVLICTDSIFLQDYIIDKLRNKLGVNREYCVRVSTEKELKTTRSNALVSPIEGKRWLVIIDMDKLGIETFRKEARRVNDNSFTLLITTKYGVFNKMRVDRDFGKQTYFVPMYFGAFAKDDITYISAGYDLTPELVSFLEKNYRRDVNKVMYLFNLLSHGTTISSTSQIIDLIGTGGLTPTFLVIDLLRTEPGSKVGMTKVRKRLIQNLEDMARKVPYHTIYQQMYQTLLGIVDIKAMNLNGEYMGLNKDIPEGFNEVRVSRLKRYMWMIHDIPIKRVLYLLSLFKQGKRYGKAAELDCLNIIFEYLGNWSV